MITLQIENLVANIEINKPPLNILSYRDIEDMSTHINSINRENGVKLVVLRSSGVNFSAGAEIKEHDKENIQNLLISLEHLVEALINVKYPTISLVSGYCLGAGLELALFCDIVLASSTASFGFPEIKLAHIPPFGISLLPAIMPEKTVTDLIITGKTIDAKEALKLGMVSNIYNEDVFARESELYIQSVMDKSKVATYHAVKILRTKFRQALEQYKSYVKPIYTHEIINHPDSEEGIKAFLSKRKPEWTE